MSPHPLLEKANRVSTGNAWVWCKSTTTSFSMCSTIPRHWRVQAKESDEEWTDLRCDSLRQRQQVWPNSIIHWRQAVHRRCCWQVTVVAQRQASMKQKHRKSPARCISTIQNTEQEQERGSDLLLHCSFTVHFAQNKIPISQYTVKLLTLSILFTSCFEYSL